MDRCAHGLYIPEKDRPTGKSWGCQQCYPDGHPEATAVPVLPNVTNRPLAFRRSGEVETCASCGNVRTFFSDECRVCRAKFPEQPFDDSDPLSGGRHLISGCPSCGSNVHYEGKRKSVWVCADCGAEYRARRKRYGR